MEITLRVAEKQDIPALQTLIPASARALSKNFYTPEQVERMVTHVFGVDTKLIEDRTYFVAEAEGLIVGCGGWSKRSTLFGGDQIKDKQDPMLDPAKDASRIRAFFIRPGWERRGIGRSIIQASEAAAQQNGFMRMELVATMPGEPLYAAMGYQVTKRYDLELDGVRVPVAHMSKVFVGRGEVGANARTGI